MSTSFYDNYSVIKPEFPVTRTAIPDWNKIQGQVIVAEIKNQQNYWYLLSIAQQYAACGFPGIKNFAVFRGVVFTFDGHTYQCFDNDASIRIVQNIPFVGWVLLNTPSLLPQFFKTFIQQLAERQPLQQILPPVIQFGKRILMTAIILSSYSKLCATDARNEMLRTQKNFITSSNAISHIPLIMDELQMLKHISNDMPDCSCYYLFRTIYMLTDGDMEKFADLAIFMTKVILGPKFCEKYLNIKPSLTILRTNNKTFVQQFFCGILDIPKTNLVQRGTNAQYKSIVKFNETINIQNGNYAVINNLSPIRTTPQLSLIRLKVLSTVQGLREIVYAESFGVHLNLSSNLDDFLDNEHQIKNLIRGNTLKFNSLLGEQNYHSECSYAAVAYQNENNNAIADITEELVLNTNIPPEIGLFERYEGFTYEEIVCGQNILPLIGVSLLLKKKNDSIQTEPKLTPFQEFIGMACKSGVQTDPKLNGVGLITLEKMFALYRQEIYNDTSEIEVNKNYLKNNGYGFMNVNSEKNAGIRNQCIADGYHYADKDPLNEVYTVNGGNYLYGITIKPKAEILDGIRKEKEKRNSQISCNKLSFSKFSKKIFQLAKETSRELIKKCENLS